MDRQPKTEPGSPPSPSHRNLKDMSIPDLVKVLRHAIRMEDYDRVEEVLVSRDARLKAEIRPLRERVEMEKLERLHAEEELRKKEELCEKGKRAQESYELLLKKVKKGGFADKDIIGELKKKNGELECEVCELRELKKKWEDDSNALIELRIRVRVLEDEKNALAALGVKNSELEEAAEKNIDGLRNENRKLVDEKCRFEYLERKFGELHGGFVRLEDDTKLVISVDASAGGANTSADPGVTTFEDKDEEDVCDYEFGNDTGGPTPLQRNEDTHHSLGAGTAKPQWSNVAVGTSGSGKKGSGTSDPGAKEHSAKKTEERNRRGGGGSSSRQSRSWQEKGIPEKGLAKSSAKDEGKEMVSSPKSAMKSTKDEKYSEETPKRNLKRKQHTSGKENESNTKKYRESLVGLRVKVWWPEDKMYYEGVINSFDSSAKKHRVLYDDGEVEILNLKKEKWEFIKVGADPDRGERRKGKQMLVN